MLAKIKAVIASIVAAYKARQERIQKEIYTKYFNSGYSYALTALAVKLKTSEQLYAETELPIRASWDTARYAGIRAAIYEHEDSAVR